MCLWERIANRLKEKEERETGPDLARIRDACDMRSASHALYDAMKRSPGHCARSELVACFQSRIQEETDMNSIYDAFEDMYRIYKQDGDALAMNIARMLGGKTHSRAVCDEEKPHKH